MKLTQPRRLTKRLTGKIAVVTGTSKGIGAAIAEQFAAEGAAVVVNYASSKTGTEAVVKRITQKDGRSIAVQADVSKAEDIQRLFAETTKGVRQDRCLLSVILPLSLKTSIIAYS